MRKIIIGLFLLTFGVIISIGLFAQPSAEPPAPPDTKGTSGNQPPPYNPPGAPIEPGAGILLIMAGAYGLKKIRDVRNVSNS
jgi:hypothetical protein